MSALSIIIVNWKTKELLHSCLQSLKKDKRFGQFEIYVVDNNSEDGSLEMLRDAVPAVHLIANQSNLGFSRACNQVIPQVKSAYVLLLNPDTKVEETALSKLIDFMEDHPNCGACGPKILNPDGSLQLACRRSFPSLSSTFFRLTYLSKLFPKNHWLASYNMTYADPEKIIQVDALSGACMLVRKSVIDQVGLLDEDIFMFGEDIDWCWRIKTAGWQIFYIPEAIVWHVHGASSKFRPIGATIDLHRGMQVFYKKHLAPKHAPPLNALVYILIWFRAGLFMLINLVRTKFLKSSTIESITNKSVST